MADLPKVNPVNIVMESEKYYDFDPSSFKNVLPTLKTVGGGIADILAPQDASDVAMMAIPPVAVYNRVKKILDRVDTLRAEAQSLFNSFNRGSRSPKDIREAQLRNNKANSMVKAIPEDDMKIYKDIKKSLTSDEVNKQGIARLRETLRKKFNKGDEVTKEDQPNFFFDTVRNVPSSAYQFGSDVAQAVTSPVQTLDAIGNLGLGLIALAIPDAYQEESLDKPQEAAMAVGQYISDRYGGLDKAKESLKTDPVGVLADVSGILLGGGYLATKSGLKAGQLATKAGIATDPLVIAGKGVSEVGKGITRRDVLKGTGAGLASLAVPMSMVTDVTKAIPPVAKSSGILAGIGKFKGIMNNLEPYLLGSKRRDQMNPGKFGSNKRAEAIDRLYPEIGYNKAQGITERFINNNPKLSHKDNILKFQKSYNLEPEDFTFIDQNRLALPEGDFHSIKTETIDSVEDIFKKLDDAPDKKVTVKKTGKMSEKMNKIDPSGLYREHTLTTGTVDGVPIMKSEIYTNVSKHPFFKNYPASATLYIPNKSGLEKLSKSKPKLAKGGSVDKSLYADQKYI